MTPAQLLGREEEEKATRLSEAEEKMNALLPRARELPRLASAQFEVVDEL